MASYHLTCADCGYETPEDRCHVNCPECQGFLEVTLDDPMERRLPDPDQESIFKYHRLMPYDVSDPELVSRESIGETPVVPAPVISEELDVEVHLKDETVFPTGTWKDREGFVSLHRLWKNGLSDMVLFSSGNTGTSLARSASLFRGPRLHLFVPEASRARVSSMPEFYDPDFVKIYYGTGSNDECNAQAEAFAREKGLAPEGGFRNYARREGLKLFGLECLFAWGTEPDWYVQAVAGGIGVYSYLKACDDAGRDCPKILGVQHEVCAPMVNAWKDGAEKLEDRHVPPTIAPSDFVRVLRTRKPYGSYPVLKRVMDRVEGRFESVSDENILEALRLFYAEDYITSRYHEKGVVMGLEPAAALAGVVRAVREGYIRKGEKVLLNVSGAGKKGDIKMEWIGDLLDG